MTGRPTLLLAMDPARTRHVLGPTLLDRLRASVTFLTADPIADFETPDARTLMAGADILLTGWGCPPIGPDELVRLARLRLIAHAAGTVKTFLHPAVFERGILVSTASEANAQPVAEFTLALILLTNKRAFAFETAYREDRGRDRTIPMMADPIGNRGRTVGIVGASRIGRRVLELLRPFELNVLLFDPFVGEAEAAHLGARPVELAELLRSSDVVSLHAPLLPETRHMIDGVALRRIRDGATLINTARGALIDEAALLVELGTGRLNAMIDVTDPEIPDRKSPFYDLPNVFLTPHIAGAIGLERERLGEMAVEEVERFARGLPLRHALAFEQWEFVA